MEWRIALPECAIVLHLCMLVSVYLSHLLHVFIAVYIYIAVKSQCFKTNAAYV